MTTGNEGAAVISVKREESTGEEREETRANYLQNKSIYTHTLTNTVIITIGAVRKARNEKEEIGGGELQVVEM